jgi:hypothetical protein
MSYFTSIQYNDSGSLDAFSRLRTSSPEAIFSIQSQYDTNPIQMEGGVTGTGVAPLWDANIRMVALTVAAGTGLSYYQSYQYNPYQPGKSQFIALTGVIGTGVANQILDIGYGDSLNGIFLRQNGASGLQVVQRSSTSGSVVNTTVNQASWNIDNMNGTGPSGITLDVTKAQILVIDLQFLGMGRVRFGFDIDGVIYYFHQFLNANNLAVPYMQSATLPVSMTLTGTAAAAPKTFYFKCATVISEGGILQEYGITSSTPSVAVTATNAVRTVALSVRPKTTFGGVPNRSFFLLENISMFVTGNMDVYWELVTGAVITGQTWANINTANSAFEYSSVPGVFGNLTTGQVIASGYCSRLGGTNNGTLIDINSITSINNPIALNRAGAVTNNGTLTLLVQGLSANSAMQSNIGFREIR